MNILVVGGAGFAGSSFTKYLLEKYTDYRIISIDKAGSENLNEVEDNEQHVFNLIDITDKTTLLSLFKYWYGFDVVINFASDSNNYLNTDIFGTINLLEAIRKYKPKRYIQISVSDVYGSVDTGKALESTLLNPSSLCSSTKASADLISLSYFKSFNVPVIVSRCSNAFGPFQNENRFLPKMIMSALQGQKVKVHNAGNDIRDFVYILDYCRALDTLIHYGKTGEIYNIGGCNEYKSIDLARYIITYTGAGSDMLEMMPDMSVCDLRMAVNYSKMAQLGWKPMQDFKLCLNETIDWFKDKINKKEQT